MRAHLPQRYRYSTGRLLLLHHYVAAAVMVLYGRAEVFELASQAADVGVDHAFVAARAGAVPHMTEYFETRKVPVAV